MALSRGDYKGAVNLFKEGVALSGEVGDRANLAYCLEGLAVVAGVRKLSGCPSTFIMNPIAPPLRAHGGRSTLANGCGNLRGSASSGTALTFKQAVACALEGDEASPA